MVHNDTDVKSIVNSCKLYTLHTFTYILTMYILAYFSIVNIRIDAKKYLAYPLKIMLFLYFLFANNNQW